MLDRSKARASGLGDGDPRRRRGRHCAPRDGWALIVSTRDAEAAREALDAYERENIADTVDVDADAVAPARGAAVVGVAIGLLLIGFFAVTGMRASRSIWFERGSADAERIVAGEWWRTVTALTLHADAPHVIGNAGASAVLVGAVSHPLGPGIGLCVLLLAGAGGNALTAAGHGTHHDSVGASTAMFGAIGILGATRVVPRGRRLAARKPWMVVAASRGESRLLALSARARAPISSHICSGSCSAAPWAWLLRPRCCDLSTRSCSGRSPRPPWRCWSARGYALSPKT